MKAGHVWLSILILAIILIALSCDIYIQNSKRGPTLFCNAPNPYLGDILQFHDTVYTFTLENRGNTPLEITSVTKSCVCTSVKLDITKILPGHQVKVDVTVSPGDRFGHFKTQIYLNWNLTGSGRKNGVTALSVRGNVVAALRVNPTLVDFGPVSDEVAEIHKTVIITRGNAGIPWDGIDVSSGKSICRAIRHNANDYEIVVSIQPCSLPMGNFNDSLKIIPKLKSAPAEKPLEIPVYAKIISDLVYNPTTIYFGTLPTGTERRGYVSLTTSAGPPFEVFQVECSNPQIMTTSVTKYSKNMSRITYFFHPGKNQKNLSGLMRIVIHTKDKNKLLIIPYIAYLE